MIKLLIDNREVDVLPNTITITRQAYDFKDLQTRYLGRSNQFTVPNTQNNKQILGNPSALASTNRPFEKRFRASIIDGTTLLQGYAIIEESNSEYKVRVVGGEKDFFESMKAKLNQLDFELDDFTYNISAYNTLKVPTTSVWLWAGHSANEDRAEKNTVISATDANKIKYTRPWFNSKVIIQKIFDTYGWSFDNIRPFEELENAIISSNHKQFFVTSYQKTLDLTFAATATPTNLTDLDTNDFEKDVTTASTTIEIGDTKTKFRLRGSVELEEDMKITFEGVAGAPDLNEQNQTFVIRKEETEIDITTNAFETDASTNTIQIKISTLSGTGDLDFNETLLYTIIEEQDLGDLSGTPIEDYKVKVYDNLPDISQYDLIVKNYFVIFGAAFNADSFTKKLNVFGFDKFSSLNCYDWCGKFVKGTERITGYSSSYGQLNYFDYNNDDITQDGVGSASFTIDNVNLQKEVVLTDLSFSASNEVIISGETLIDMPIYGDDPDNPGTQIRIAKAGMRIGQYYYDGGSTYTLIDFNALSFSSIVTKYYRNIINSLQRQRFITSEFNLSKKDVIGFDFGKCAYVDELGGHYLVMNIADYLPGQKTQCNLLKFE